MKRWIAWVVAVLLLGGISGCGKGQSERGSEGAGSAAAGSAAAGSAAAGSSAAAFDFKSMESGPPMGPKLRALLEAASAAGGQDSQPVPASAPEREAARAQVAAALAAWAESGEAASVVEEGVDPGKLMGSIAGLRALMRSLARSDDATAAALLRLCAGLRAPGNLPIAMAIGNTLALETAEHLLGELGQPATEALRAHALTEEDALRFGRASLAQGLRLANMITREALEKEAAAQQRETGEALRKVAPDGEPQRPAQSAAEILRERTLRGLPVTGDWLTAELDEYAAFWKETEQAAAKLHQPAELAQLLEARRQAGLTHPTSMLVRLVVDLALMERSPSLTTQLVDNARRYQELLAKQPS